MSATDPLRDALTAAEHEMACAAQLLHDHDHCSECAVAADTLASACERAREVLAAVPAEPERNDARDQIGVCEHCDHVVARGGKRIQTRHAVACSHLHIRSYVLAERPAEPEAWEWRALGAIVDEHTARRLDPHRHHVYRRRPGTAPGPWERVDPEPLHEMPPREFWREVPCGHPPDPIAWRRGADDFVCHCGGQLDAAKGQTLDGAPGPVVLCQKCGCHVACPEPRLQDGGE